MKVLPFKVSKPENENLVYQENHEYVFYDKLHQHEEIQLSYIKEGEGTLIVGNTINQYKTGDVLVIGGNLPHVFKSDSSTNKKSIMITIFFTKTSFGTHFFEIEEMRTIRPFFKRCVNGFIVESHHKLLQDRMASLKSKNQFERFVVLMSMLITLSKCKYKSLSSFTYNKQYSDTEGKRMSAVMEYTMNNFKDKISLEDIAQVSAMTKNAFCKYFKKRTNKTYFQFLNELRIEHACKLLISNKELVVADVAEQSGFNNMSNFNRQFKLLKETTPSRYASLG